MNEVEINSIATKYEITVILPIDGKIESVEKTIADSGSQVVKTTDQGVKPFAYPIKKLESGHYFVIQFAATAENLKKLNEELKHEGSIIRFLVIKALRFPALRPPKKERTEKTEERTETSKAKEVVAKSTETESVDIAPKLSQKTEAAPEKEGIKIAQSKPTTPEKKTVKAKKPEKNVKISADELDKKLEELVED